MKAKLILMVWIFALCAPMAWACPPCDEPWTGTFNCTPADRIWYCCVQTDQCHLGDGPFDPWPVWQIGEVLVDEVVCGVMESEEGSVGSKTGEEPEPQASEEPVSDSFDPVQKRSL